MKLKQLLEQILMKEQYIDAHIGDKCGIDIKQINIVDRNKVSKHIKLGNGSVAILKVAGNTVQISGSPSISPVWVPVSALLFCSHSIKMKY